MKRKILIIEDNRDLQQIYKVYFEKSGLLVYISGDGANGINDILKYKPDIILLDVMLPNLDGFQILEIIKTQSSILTPVIVCSTISQQKSIERLYQLGADLFINKGETNGEEVVRKVLQVLR